MRNVDPHEMMGLRGTQREAVWHMRGVADCISWCFFVITATIGGAYGDK